MVHKCVNAGALQISQSVRQTGGLDPCSPDLCTSDEYLIKVGCVAVGVYGHSVLLRKCQLLLGLRVDIPAPVQCSMNNTVVTSHRRAMPAVCRVAEITSQREVAGTAWCWTC